VIAFSVEDPHLALVAIRALPEPDACVDPALRVGGDVGHHAAPGELSPALNELVLIVSDSHSKCIKRPWYIWLRPSGRSTAKGQPQRYGHHDKG